MKPPSLVRLLTCATLMLCGASLAAEDSTPPFSAAEREQVYTTSISKRAAGALEALAISDTAKSNKVHDLIMNQYRALRARDEAMDNLFAALGKTAPGVETNRSIVLPVLAKQQHEQFVAKLAAELTPMKIEEIKNEL